MPHATVNRSRDRLIDSIYCVLFLVDKATPVSTFRWRTSIFSFSSARLLKPSEGHGRSGSASNASLLAARRRYQATSGETLRGSPGFLHRFWIHTHGLTVDSFGGLWSKLGPCHSGAAGCMIWHHLRHLFEMEASNKLASKDRKAGSLLKERKWTGQNPR